MISKYPEYNKEFIFNTEKEIVEEKIDFIRQFRNVKKENDIPKEAKVNINTNDNIIIKMLKLEDSIIPNTLDIKSYEVKTNNIKATIYYEKEETDEDKLLKEKQINDLKASIERREKLLSNENYVSKAPLNIVEMDRKKLAEEKEKLDSLLK